MQDFIEELDHGYPLCQKDRFPKVKINGQLECVAEYIDERVGQKKVVDLIEEGGIYYYIFENGYQFPLLCSCCGEGLELEDVAKSKKDIKGRRLESMSIERYTGDNGDFMGLQLEFSGKGLLVQSSFSPFEKVVEVWPKAAAQMKLNPLLKPPKSPKISKKKKGFG